jgi:hypothetical protein
MNKPHICMFCRYRKSRAGDLDACCAGAEALRAKPDAWDRVVPGAARAMPDRLRPPALRRHPPR